MCVSKGAMCFCVYTGEVETCIDVSAKSGLWLCVSRCRWVSWLLLSFGRWSSFPMWFAGAMCMCLPCTSMLVCLSPGA